MRQLQLIMQLIDGKPGQTGGVANIPTQGNVPPGFKYTVVPGPDRSAGHRSAGLYLDLWRRQQRHRQGCVERHSGRQRYAADDVCGPLLLGHGLIGA